MTLVKPIEDTQARCDALDAAAKTFFEAQGYVYKDTFVPLNNHSDDELLKGVVMFGASGEKGYSQSKGQETKKGTTRVLLLLHLKVGEKVSGKILRQKEQTFFGQVKAFIRTGLPGVTLQLEQVQQSRQLTHPYGWAVAYIDIVPPAASTH